MQISTTTTTAPKAPRGLRRANERVFAQRPRRGRTPPALPTATAVCATRSPSHRPDAPSGCWLVLSQYEIHCQRLCWRSSIAVRYRLRHVTAATGGVTVGRYIVSRFAALIPTVLLLLFL